MLKTPTPSDNSRKIKKHKPCSFKVLVLSPFLSEDTPPVLLIQSFRFKSIGLPGSAGNLEATGWSTTKPDVGLEQDCKGAAGTHSLLSLVRSGCLSQ